MDKRTEYIESLSAQMVEWDVQIDKLKDKAKSAPETDSEYAQTIEALQHKRNEAGAKLQTISIAGDHEWEDLKTGTDQIWDEVRTSLRDAVLKIK